MSYGAMAAVLYPPSSLSPLPFSPSPSPSPLLTCSFTNIYATRSHSPSDNTPIQRLVLSNPGRTKLDPTPDRNFYALPRLVKHVDDAFLRTLTSVYRQRIPANAEILDLMSSWVSHLPPDITYRRVVGHGLNAFELSKNSRLDYFFVKDLNEDQKLEMADCSFDAVLCTVSVQYLEQPERVFAEIYRVLRPGGVCIVSFSNRMFYDKAIAAWRDGTPFSRTQLVREYFLSVEGFTEPEVVKRLPGQEKQKSESKGWISWLLGLMAVANGDPFYAVIAYRNYKPIY